MAVFAAVARAVDLCISFQGAVRADRRRVRDGVFAVPRTVSRNSRNHLAFIHHHMLFDLAEVRLAQIRVFIRLSGQVIGRRVISRNINRQNINLIFIHRWVAMFAFLLSDLVEIGTGGSAVQVADIVGDMLAGGASNGFGGGLHNFGYGHRGEWALVGVVILEMKGLFF